VDKKKAELKAQVEQLKKEEEIRNAVSESLGRLIQVVIKLMSKEDYTKFSRKVSKNLNNLDPKITDVTSLKKLIDTRRENIQAEEKNVFVHIKAVFDELKKYKKTGSSDNDVPKDAVKGEVASSSAPQVFRWMDGNDNPAEGDSTAAVVIEDADDDDQASKLRETRTWSTPTCRSRRRQRRQGASWRRRLTIRWNTSSQKLRRPLKCRTRGNLPRGKGSLQRRWRRCPPRRK